MATPDMAAGPTASSLVKYDVPVLVSTNKGGSASIPGMTETQDMLNSILPPREWTKDGELWVQHVSATPATRVDVISLQESLDHALQQRQARETGICPIREELYAQCLDELIRQITVNCLERGLLLKRVRDELRDTAASYQSLYESSVAYGMRKALVAEQRRGALRQLIAKLSAHKAALETEAAGLESRLSSLEEDEKAKREAASASHEDEVRRLREQNAALKAQLEELLAPPSK
ncbi:IDA4 [Symbiodinium sp. KB8]|uniref:Inner dynein arm light chain, axonemal n=2 Tax=Cafeteria roenbergensis TaxID=33653 RepID=A0A5A8DU56_CAFRO|nr:hypothetical protein FNF28_02576 [Cafeteria roenbergensis]CAE7217776.1 IDA4 [Symbiodinium sp. KB8]